MGRQRRRLVRREFLTGNPVWPTLWKSPNCSGVAAIADLWTKDWYKNTGYFKMYFQPPGSNYANGFGDGAAFDALSNSDYTAMIMFAVGAENGYFKWYAQQLQQR